MRRVDANLAPLVNQPRTVVFIGLIYVTIEQLEVEVFPARPPLADASPRPATCRCPARIPRSAVARPCSVSVANRERRCCRPVLTIATLESPGALPQRSIAKVKARRTRTSPNGFFRWLKLPCPYLPKKGRSSQFHPVAGQKRRAMIVCCRRPSYPPTRQMSSWH